MQSTFDERNWLAWLVKVRILILTFLLGIELAVAELTPTPLPMRLFVSTILFWYSISLFYVLLLSFWQEHRLQASLQVLTDLVLVSLVVHETGGWDSSLNFLYPLVIIVASVLLPRVWAHSGGCPGIYSVRHGSRIELLRRDSVVLHDPSRTESAAGHHFRQSLCLPGCRLSGRAAHRQTAPGAVELKDASGALENLQALHENIVQSVSSGLITTGLDGRITLVNAAAHKLLERTPAELIGRCGAELFLDPLAALLNRNTRRNSPGQPRTSFARPCASGWPP